MKIAELLGRRGRRPLTISPDAALLSVAGAVEDDGAVIVSRDGDRFEGVLSARDIAGAMARYGPYAAHKRVGDVMTTDEPTCSPGDRIDAVVRMIERNRSPHVAVVENGVAKGVISARDIVGLRLQELQRETDAIRAYIAF